MPQPKKHPTDADRIQAYRERHKIKRIVVDCRDDAPINKDVLQKAANELEIPLSILVLQAVGEFILNHLGPEWLEKNQGGISTEESE